MRRLLLPALIIVLVGSGVSVFLFRERSSDPLGAEAPTSVSPAPTRTQGVVAEAKVLPAVDVTLSFLTPGTVAAILVAEGEPVEVGQPLARLDTRMLELKVAQARVNYEQAQARYNQLAVGVSPEALTAAEAAVSTARANQAQAAATVTSPDITAAEAQLIEAKAVLARLLNGPKDTELTQAQAVLDQAQANLSLRRDELSAAKTTAQLQLELAANNLRNAQDGYSRIYWENRELEKLPGDLPQTAIDAESEAERAVQDSQRLMEQAQVAWDQARQAEVEGIAAAEAQVRDAQAQRDQLVAPPDDDRAAAARAQVAAAEANIARLRGPVRTTQLDVAAASVAQAEAARDQIAAPPRTVDLIAAQVAIDAAQVALDQAQLELDQATLHAPIEGTVAQLNIDIGALAGPATPAMVIADLSNWKIETDDLTELDVVKLREGDSVTITFDALPELHLPGKIVQIKPLGGERQGDVVYTVVASLEQLDPRLRWNMTAVLNASSSN